MHHGYWCLTYLIFYQLMSEKVGFLFYVDIDCISYEAYCLFKGFYWMSLQCFVHCLDISRSKVNEVSINQGLTLTFLTRDLWLMFCILNFIYFWLSTLLCRPQPCWLTFLLLLPAKSYSTYSSYYIIIQLVFIFQIVH